MLIIIMAWSSWQLYQSILRRERSQKDLYSRHILPWYWHLILITHENMLNEHHWVRHKWPLVLLTILFTGTVSTEKPRLICRCCVLMNTWICFCSSKTSLMWGMILFLVSVPRRSWQCFTLMCGKALLITGWCKYWGDNCVNVRTLSNVIMETNPSRKKRDIAFIFCLVFLL